MILVFYTDLLQEFSEIFSSYYDSGSSQHCCETGTAGSVSPSLLWMTSSIEARLEMSFPRLVSLLSVTVLHKAIGKPSGSLG